MKKPGSWGISHDPLAVKTSFKRTLFETINRLYYIVVWLNKLEECLKMLFEEQYSAVIKVRRTSFNSAILCAAIRIIIIYKRPSVESNLLHGNWSQTRGKLRPWRLKGKLVLFEISCSLKDTKGFQKGSWDNASFDIALFREISLLIAPSERFRDIRSAEIPGLPRCKNLWTFSLFRSHCLPALYCFEIHCCLGRSLFYVTGEFHRFLHRGWAEIPIELNI